MAKRFLCYDTDNPKGVTPDGVLDPNAMGGQDEYDGIIDWGDNTYNALVGGGLDVSTITCTFSVDKIKEKLENNIVPKVIIKSNTDTPDYWGHFIFTPSYITMHNYGGNYIEVEFPRRNSWTTISYDIDTGTFEIRDILFNTQ